MVKNKTIKQPTKRELQAMLDQIATGDNIAIFNAKKALYVYVDKIELQDHIISYLRDKLEVIDD